MRYVVTALLVLGLGITAMLSVASAQVNVPPNSSWTNQYGNQVVPMTPGAAGGTVCIWTAWHTVAPNPRQ